MMTSKGVIDNFVVYTLQTNTIWSLWTVKMSKSKHPWHSEFCLDYTGYMSSSFQTNLIFSLHRVHYRQVSLRNNIYRVFRFIGHNSIYMYTIPPTGLNFLHALQMLRISVHNSGHFLFKLFDKFSNSLNPWDLHKVIVPRFK